MNKKILIIVIGAILLSFSGCNDKRSNNSDNFTGSQITDSQDPGGKDTSLTFIKGKLIDDTAVIIEPQYDECCSFKIEYAKLLPGKDVLDIFEHFYDKLFSGSFSKEDKDNECRAIVNDESEENKSSNYPYNNPKISDIKEKILSGAFPDGVYLYIDSSNGYLAVNANGNLNGFELGRTYNIKKEQSRAGMYFPDNSSEFKKQAEYNAPISNDNYQLADKELTVSEAASAAKALIDDLYSIYNSEIRAAVSQMTVIDLGDYYGYSMSIIPSYKGIAFDAHEKTGVAGIIKQKEYSNGKKYESMPAYAFLDRSDSLDILIGYQPGAIITEIRKHTKILSREEAKEIIEKTFSSSVGLNAYKEELIYTLEIIDDSGSVFQAEPAWKFSVIDNNSHKLYIYVNAVTGECYYEPGQ